MPHTREARIGPQPIRPPMITEPPPHWGLNVRLVRRTLITLDVLLTAALIVLIALVLLTPGPQPQGQSPAGPAGATTSSTEPPHIRL